MLNDKLALTQMGHLLVYLAVWGLRMSQYPKRYSHINLYVAKQYDYFLKKKMISLVGCLLDVFADDSWRVACFVGIDST